MDIHCIELLEDPAEAFANLNVVDEYFSGLEKDIEDVVGSELDCDVDYAFSWLTAFYLRSSQRGRSKEPDIALRDH